MGQMLSLKPASDKGAASKGLGAQLNHHKEDGVISR